MDLTYRPSPRSPTGALSLAVLRCKRGLACMTFEIASEHPAGLAAAKLAASFET